MFKPVQVSKTPTVERLLKLWAQRYKPDLSYVFIQSNSEAYASLIATASEKGRALTARKLNDNLLDINTQMACIQTKSLYSQSNVLEFNETKEITILSFQIYKKLLEIYQKPSVAGALLTAELSIVNSHYDSDDFSWFGIAALEEMTWELSPILLAFQEQHRLSQDWRTLGFMTTLFNFANKLILNKLTPIEKVLLEPYLKFVEELAALPWLRVCAAAAKHDFDSPAYQVIEQMLPLAQNIAKTVYSRLVYMFPEHYSRRGKLTEPGVRHSCIRDLNMFQAYLWLCVLEENFVAIESELVTLCVMVMESVEVKWYMTEKWSQVLIEEILNRLQLEQQALLKPYIEGLQAAFFQERYRLGYQEQPIEVMV